MACDEWWPQTLAPKIRPNPCIVESQTKVQGQPVTAFKVRIWATIPEAFHTLMFNFFDSFLFLNFFHAKLPDSPGCPA